MNDKSLVELVKGAGTIFLFSFLGFVIMFFFKLIAARYFGPSDFGIYSMLETVLGLCLLIAALGLPQGLSRFLPHYKVKKQYKLLTGFVRFVSLGSFLSSIVISVLVFIFSKMITSFFNYPSEFSFFLKVLAIIIPLKIIDNFLRGSMKAYKKPFYPRLSYTSEKVILLIGVIFIWLLKLSLVYLVGLYLFAKVVPIIYNWLMYKKIVTFPRKKPNFRYKEWFKFSIPLFMTGILTFVIQWTDNLTIGRFLDPAQLGIYSITYSFAAFLPFFQGSFAQMFMPLISESHARKEKIGFLFKKSASWIFGLTLPIFLVMILYSKQVLVLFYGKEYGAGYIPLIILGIGMLINVSTGLNQQVLMLYKKTNYLFYVNIGIALGNLVLNISLVPYLGILGAAIASAIAMALQNIILLYLAGKQEKLKFDLLYNLKFIIAGIPAVLIAGLVFRIGISSYIEFVISAIIYVFLYVLILLLLKTFTKEDFKIMVLIEKKLGLKLGFLKKIIKKFY